MTNIRCQGIIFRHVEAVLFDKDGTLADSHHFLWNLGQKRVELLDKHVSGIREPLLLAFGIQPDRIDPAGLLAVGTRLENEIAAAAYLTQMGQGWIESRAIVRSAFAAADSTLGRKADHTPLFGGAVDVLKALTAAGVKVGILSADTTYHVQDFVQRYQLNPYIQLQKGTDDEPSKPDPRLFWQACERLAVSPAATVMVGDSNADIEMAQAGGANGCVAVSWGWTESSALAQAEVAIAHFRELQVQVDEHRST